MKSILLIALMMSMNVFAQDPASPSVSAPIPAQSAGTPEAPEGRWVMQKQFDMDLGYHDSVSAGKMILMGSGSSTEREFEFKQLEKSGAEGTKALVRILQPQELAGTGLLSYTNVGRSNDQWIYLPALKKTKRIAGASKSGSFIGSEFSFEDLTPPQLEDYDYTLVSTEACGSVTCYVVESKPHDADSSYSKIVTWIRTDNFQNVKADMYNKSGSLFKQVAFEDIRQLNGKFWRPFKMVMKNLQNSNETQLIVSNYQLQTGLNTSNFSQAVLER